MINLSFKQIRVLREDQAREVLVSIRWPDGAICPHCGADKPYPLTSNPDSKHQRRAGLYKCSKCRKQFTVTVGTVFDGSRIKIKDWIMALYLMCSSKKGMSAHQLHRTMGVTYKTAWFMAHRIRLAMTQETLDKPLDGEVEIDLTYVGGMEHNKHKHKKTPNNQGSSTKTRVAVFALVERGGEVKARKMKYLARFDIRQEVTKHVSPTAKLMTDEAPAYRILDDIYEREFVLHKSGEYVRDGVSTNNLEGWFALLKRGVHGTFHHVSAQHIDRYINEFAFRYNNRKITDAERAVKALSKIGGKKLKDKEAVG